jgi:hypothetical protein
MMGKPAHYPVTLAAFATLVSTGPNARIGHAEGAAAVQRERGPVALAASADVTLPLLLGGVAAGAEVRFGRLGARLTGSGLLTVVTEGDGGVLTDSHYYITAQGDGVVYAFPLRLGNGFELGLSAAAGYNSLLGVGYGGALEGRRQVGTRLGLGLALGVTHFPDSEGRVAERKGFADETDFLHLPATEVQTRSS